MEIRSANMNGDSDVSCQNGGLTMTDLALYHSMRLCRGDGAHMETQLSQVLCVQGSVTKIHVQDLAHIFL